MKEMMEILTATKTLSLVVPISTLSTKAADCHSLDDGG